MKSRRTERNSAAPRTRTSPKAPGRQVREEPPVVVLYHPATWHERFYSFFWIPYAVLTLASMLADKFRVLLFDDNLLKGGFDFGEIPTDCLCVGISCMTGRQIEGALTLSRGVRQVNPHIPIIWGGPHPTLMPRLTISNDLVDIVVRGQGEFAFSEIVNRLNSGLPLLDVPGVLLKADGKIVEGPSNRLRSKDQMPAFPWNLIKIEDYIRTDPKIGGRILNYVSSQGCPFPCTFCSEVALYGQRWVSYGVEKVLADLDYLVNVGGANAIKFYDANFFANLTRVRAIASAIIQKGWNISWAASGHPKMLASLDGNDWLMLKRSGCTRLLIGAESGSEEILSAIKKSITPDLLLDLSRRCSAQGIAASFTFIVGFPGFTVQDEIQKTLDLALKLRSQDAHHDVKIHFYAPYPGTPLFETACRAGFQPPRTLVEWAAFDYYNIETPWVEPHWQDVIHAFNAINCPYVHL